MKKNYKTLLTNSDGFPLSIISWQKAFTMICKQSVEQVDFYDDYARDGRGYKYPVPAVIMRKTYLKRDHKKAPYNRKNVFMRDGLTCQYCNKKFHVSDLTLDHVLPRKLKGESSFTNIVTSCYPCNRKKADKTCDECGMWPIKTPIHPGYNQLFLGIFPWSENVPSEWKTYLSVLPSFKDRIYVEA